jgi:UDP-N-acetylglucosamine/UDP-N-acetylgalactosamine diphosphorylase
MKQELQHLLSAHGQEHLLAFWDELADEQRRTLADEIRRLDFALVNRLFREKSVAEDWATKAKRATPPPAARLNNTQSTQNPFPKGDAVDRGREVLSAGEVAAVIVAGGQGTRLGFDHPKGMFPIGPVSGSSLFRILFEKVLATSRRYEVRVPLYIMTSRATHDETIDYLETHNRFGLPAEDVRLFCQGQMPAVDLATGKVLLADKHQVALSPDGHGGMLAALANCGALDEMERRGIRHLFYCQVDNPLAPLCDAEFIGYHVLAESELSTQVVAKQDPLEKVGNVALVDGRMTIIEYSDLPEPVARTKNADGSLYLWAGNTGIHAFDVQFLRRMTGTAGALPFHLARKKVPYVDRAGELIEPDSPNAMKFERFIFDLLPAAQRAFVMEVDAACAFAPVKNAPGEARDTPESVQAQMIQLHKQWLATTGVAVEPGVAVECSPLFALDEADVIVRQKEGRLPRQLHVTQPKFFC